MCLVNWQWVLIYGNDFLLPQRLELATSYKSKCHLLAKRYEGKQYQDIKPYVNSHDWIKYIHEEVSNTTPLWKWKFYDTTTCSSAYEQENASWRNSINLSGGPN